MLSGHSGACQVVDPIPLMGLLHSCRTHAVWASRAQEDLLSTCSRLAHAGILLQDQAEQLKGLGVHAACLLTAERTSLAAVAA